MKSLLAEWLKADSLALKPTPASRPPRAPAYCHSCLHPWARRGLCGATHNQTARGGSGQMNPQTPHCGRRAGKLAKTLGCSPPAVGSTGLSLRTRPSLAHPLCPTHCTCWRPSLAWRAVGAPCQTRMPTWPGGLLSEDRALLREDCTAGSLDAAASSPAHVLPPRAGRAPTPFTGGETKRGRDRTPCPREEVAEPARPWESTP